MGDQMKRKLRYGVLAAAAVMAGSAAVSTGVQAGGNHHPAAAEGATIEVVTHGQASDPFWSVFKKGVDDAAAADGRDVNYSAPATFDMVEMASAHRRRRRQGARRPRRVGARLRRAQGLACRRPRGRHPDHHGELRVATYYQEIGAITHIGQDETIAGEAAGQRLADAGATHVMCINQEVGNAGLDARCAGAKTSIEAAGGHARRRPGRPQRRRRRAEHDQAANCSPTTRIDAVLALGPTGAAPALAAIEELGKTGDILLGTFDLSPDVIQAIIDGNMLFAVDQQQYLQGYLPIVFLTLYHDNLNTVGGGQPVLTGPGFVDARQRRAGPRADRPGFALSDTPIGRPDG